MRRPANRPLTWTRLADIRLITWGGTFDRRYWHYLGNVLAFASYVDRKSRGLKLGPVLVNFAPTDSRASYGAKCRRG